MASKPKESNQEVITAYKGFDKDMKCRGYQYEISGTYQHDGEVEACASGFHACEYPLDVFSYYPPAGSVFAVVEQSGKLARSNDSKVASQTISIKASIDLPNLIKAAIEYAVSRCKPIDPASPSSATGDWGAASATGDQGADRWIPGTHAARITLSIRRKLRRLAVADSAFCQFVLPLQTTLKSGPLDALQVVGVLLFRVLHV